MKCIKNRSWKLFLSFAGCLWIIGGLTSCQKFTTPPMDFKTEDTAALNGPLVTYFAFEDGSLDSVSSTKAASSNVTYVDGINGKAYKGASNATITVPAAGRLADLKSFTVSLWINTQKHTGGAQSVFMLTNTSDFWGNMFMLIEGNGGPTDSMQIKFNFDGQWLDWGGTNRWANMYGHWVHLAFTYDAQTSKVAVYRDGQKITLPAGWEDRKSGGNPLGELTLTNASKFVIGAFQQHLGAPFGNPDSWMLRYTGLLDQFRIYNIVLSDTEIAELFNKKQ